MKKHAYNLIEVLVAGVLIMVVGTLLFAAFYRTHKGLRDELVRNDMIRQLQIWERRFRSAEAPETTLKFLPKNFEYASRNEKPPEGGTLFVVEGTYLVRDHSAHKKTRRIPVRFVRRMEIQP